MRCAALRCAVPEARVVMVVVVMQTLSAYFCVMDIDTYLPSPTPPGCFITHYLPTYNGTYTTLHYPLTTLPAPEQTSTPTKQPEPRTCMRACVGCIGSYTRCRYLCL
jgi:hypothetical protein